jgi:hypothetical protein
MSEQRNWRIPPTTQPIVVLQRIEEDPEWREVMVSAMCLCADKRIVLSYSEDLYGPKKEMFSSNLMLHIISFGLRF